MARNILLGPTDPLSRRDAASYLDRMGLAVLTPADEAEALALVRHERRLAALVADLDRDGLALALAARKIAPDLAIVFAAEAPHRHPQASLVRSAPVLRSPASPHQLLAVVKGLGRRVLDEVA